MCVHSRVHTYTHTMGICARSWNSLVLNCLLNAYFSGDKTIPLPRITEVFAVPSCLSGLWFSHHHPENGITLHSSLKSHTLQEFGQSRNSGTAIVILEQYNGNYRGVFHIFLSLNSQSSNPRPRS